MDIKLKSNKVSKNILFFIMILSIALMSLVLKNDYRSDGYESSFFESKDFMTYIRSNVEAMYDEVDDTFENKSHYKKMSLLKYENNIKYLVVNNETNKIFSNTKYKTISEFRDYANNFKTTDVNVKTNVNGYVEIEGENYNFNIKINDEKVIEGQGDTEGANEKKDISLYAIISEELPEADTLKSLFTTYSSGRNASRVVLAISIIGLISLIFTTFIYKKIGCKFINKESEIYKKYTKFPIEFKVAFILILMIIDRSNNIYNYHHTTNSVAGIALEPKVLIGCILVKMIYITMIYLLIENMRDGALFRNSIVGKIIIASRKIGLIKRIIAIFTIITISNMGVFILITVAGSYRDAAMIGIVVGAISFVAFIAYIISKLGYLNEIMEGINKIKNGNINYKIEVRGNDEFTVLAENINDIGNGLDNAIEERMKSEKMKSELITNVSHDLKTPLTSILNYVDLLMKEDVKPDYLNDYIKILDKKSKRLKILIEDLFEAAKATSGSVELNIEKIQLNQLLTQSIAEMEGKLKEAELDIKFNFPENKVYINADGKKLFRVFENLISNIVKYSLKGTRVYVDMNYDDEYAYVNFKNISAYELNFDEGEIIERFKRGDISRSEEGSGLGLSIAKGLVELQGGEFIIQTDGDLFKAIVKLRLSNE